MFTEYPNNEIHKPGIIITPLPDKLDWELTTTRNVDSVYLVCSIGRIEVAGGWAAIEKDSEFKQSCIAGALAENIQICMDNFLDEPQGRERPHLKPEVFKGLSLHDFTCEEINSRALRMNVKVSVDCFLEVCCWLKEIGMCQAYYS